MKALVISDVELDMIYSPLVAKRFGDVDLIFACGDLPYYYMEYVISMLNRPMYYVRGNHAPVRVEEGSGGQREEPWGGINLHRKVKRDHTGLLVAGIEGSLKYNNGPHQFSQLEMWLMICLMIPRLLFNRILYGRYLDIFITHAPPWQIHDKEDLPHQGIRAFRWFIEVFRPAYHLHGHIHVYQQYDTTETRHHHTQVINAYGFKKINFEVAGKRSGIQPVTEE